LEELLSKQLWVLHPSISAVHILTDRLAEVEIKSAWSEIQQLWNELQDKQATAGPLRAIAGSKKANKAAAKKPGMATKEAIDWGFAGMWKITGTQEFNQKVVQTYLQEARGRKSTLVFCANLAVMRDLTTKFKNAGIKAESVSTKTPQVKRLRIIDDFKQQKLAVILNCEVFREGADLPSVRS
jgi:superfamily II DNA or RNA helicase